MENVIDDLISVIVPVFNVEQYLERCIQSLVKQTYRPIEIILVDDGSTDTSGIICDEWSGKDNRIRVVHKSNGGLSSARNSGIEVAKGTYFGFVDSDDFVSEDMYERLHTVIRLYNSDVACCSTVLFSNEDTLITSNKEPYTYEMDDLGFYSDCISCKNGNGVGVCNKLFKKEIFNDIRFKEGIYVEDYYTFPDIVDKIQRAVMISFPGYFYFQRSSGITRNFYRSSEKHIHDRLLGCNHNIEVLQKKSDSFKILLEHANVPRYLAISRIAGLCGTTNYKKQIKAIRKKLRSEIILILGSEYISRGVKRSYLMWFLCPPLYYTLYKINKRMIRG